MFNDHTVGIGGSVKTRASIEILNDVTLTSGSSGVNSILSGRNSDAQNRRRSKSASVLDSRFERCIKTNPLKVSSNTSDKTSIDFYPISFQTKLKISDSTPDPCSRKFETNFRKSASIQSQFQIRCSIDSNSSDNVDHANN